ncbi:MAG TPA: DUF4918 family protein [Arcobacter sp.]|nr:DUF4918 family protein [Arcobacter sp.]
MLVEELKERYISSSIFDDEDIIVLDDFLDNWENVKRFNEKYYDGYYPKTVLCGINPGKNGAGKTGVPFLDFSSLSKLIDGVVSADTERSAQFFYDIAEEIDAEKFYRSFYVTNISWIGFTKDGNNKNYYELSDSVKDFIYDAFKYEMSVVAPKTIISLSQEVKKTVNNIFKSSGINTSASLPHPNYCAFPKNYEKCKMQYIEMLAQYIK